MNGCPKALSDRFADFVVGVFFRRYVDGYDHAYPTMLGVFIISAFFGYMTWLVVENAVAFVSLWGMWFGPFYIWNSNGFKRHCEALGITKTQTSVQGPKVVKVVKVVKVAKNV